MDASYTPQAPSRPLWTSPEGCSALRSIVRARLPQWRNGLTVQQEEPIQRILDGQDVLLFTATGAGKSALFMVPILAHLELSAHPERYPAFPRRQHPVGVIITPTKGLASNIVQSLQTYRISAVAYDRETLSQRRSLASDIASCKSYNIICVDPEHLATPEWRKIIKCETFATNLVFFCVEEVHLLTEWITFRAAYGAVGPFIRGNTRAGVSTFGISATVQPGGPTNAIRLELGLHRSNNVFEFRYSNERPEIQFTLSELTNGLNSRTFPQLIPLLNAGRKTIIYTLSLNCLTNIFHYLCSMLPDSVNPGRRIRPYSALCDSEFNLETLRLATTDPELQIIVASVALANGIHCTAIEDAILVGMPGTLAQMEQEIGRPARTPGAIGRGFVFVQKADITKAQKYLEAIASQSTATQTRPAKKSKSKSAAEAMDVGKARLLTESTCLIAARNRAWENPPLLETERDCIAAQRLHPCSLCASRSTTTDVIPSHPLVHPFRSPPPSAPRTSNPRSETLRKAEKPEIESMLAEFGEVVFTERRGEHRGRPRAWFFPLSLRQDICSSALKMRSRDDLVAILLQHQWVFCALPENQRRVGEPNLVDRLWAEISDTRGEVWMAREEQAMAKERQKAKKRAREEEGTDGSDEEFILAPKRAGATRRRTLDDATNADADGAAVPDDARVSAVVLRRSTRNKENRSNNGNG
ncbi:P-loop containing nucleoside triphosphate hydrolase protein [Mycena kentingensis (nom. inval.)]|nr:P-loop containing nucleoside triphosphate hydrolase protein [Mycena kentingensis (nom. inval.)]